MIDQSLEARRKKKRKKKLLNRFFKMSQKKKLSLFLMPLTPTPTTNKSNLRSLTLAQRS
jgi:hypothetical protein